MKKKIKSLAFVLLVSSLLLLLFSCGEVNVYTPQEEDRGEGTGPMIASSFYAAFDSEPKFFGGEEDITLTLKFGIDCYACRSGDTKCYDHAHMVGKRVGLFLVLMPKNYTDPQMKRMHLLKESTDFFCNDKYMINFVPGAKRITMEDFNFSEEVTIPHDLFTASESGSIGFALYELDEESGDIIPYSDESLSHSPNPVSQGLYLYKTDGESVHFNNKEYSISTKLWYDTENVTLVKREDKSNSYYAKNLRESSFYSGLRGAIKNIYVSPSGNVSLMIKQGNRYETLTYDPMQNSFSQSIRFRSSEDCLTESQGMIYVTGKEIVNFSHDIFDIAPTEDSEANRKIAEELLLLDECTVNGITYKIKNPSGAIGEFFDKLGIYTQLVLTDKNGNERIVYDATRISVLIKSNNYSDAPDDLEFEERDNRYSVEYNDYFKFTPRDDGTCMVTPIDTVLKGIITIPEVSPSGLRVTEIYKFSGHQEITEIVIPNSVTRIDERAFSNCTSLTAITIPDSVTAINFSTFQNCTALSSVKLGNATAIIGENAFSGCKSLTEISIPDSVIKIDDQAFRGCTSLSAVNFGGGVRYIGSSAFRECGALTSITIPEKVTAIEYSTFAYCSSLEEVIIPDGVIKIGNDAFTYCTNLKKVTLPESVKVFGTDIFLGCYNLEE